MSLTDPAFARQLLQWYDRVRRNLPWRAVAAAGTYPDPYHVLVSETMLQQTQVVTVIPYFQRFLERFPTLTSLAGADEQDVLRLWQGLGYYSRARNLQKAARAVTENMAGRIPDTVEQLLDLPGVGRYTAGAIASLAFGVRAPILDGNVQRVLCRLDQVKTDPREPRTRQKLWQRAEQILPPQRVGDFNSALMELGATLCTPRGPQCLLCPVRDHCRACAAGTQEKIPVPKKSKPTPLICRNTYCIRHDDRWLIKQRPAKGRWAGLWQFITLEAEVPMNVPVLPITTTPPRPLGVVTHSLTHRRYRFEVFVCETVAVGSAPDLTPSRRWTTLDRLQEYPLPRPHLKIAEMLRALGSNPN